MFMTDTFDEAGEDYVKVLRADRSIDTATGLYNGFFAYALVMVVVWPIGVPLLYSIMLYRSRHMLRELRQVEMTVESKYSRAKLRAHEAQSKEQAAAIVHAAHEERNAGRAFCNELREALPTALRRLTAGCTVARPRSASFSSP